MALTVADIQRWSAESVRDVFHAGQARAQSTLAVSRELSTLRVFDTWRGQAAAAAQHSIAQTRQDLDAHGREVLAVARAAETAADGIERIQRDLRQLGFDAEAHGLEIDPGSNRIVPIPHSRHGRREMQAAIPALQARLDALVTEANAIDAALATAIDMADGDMPLPASVPSPEGSNPMAAPGNQQIKGISASQAAIEQLQRGLVADQTSAAGDNLSGMATGPQTPDTDNALGAVAAPRPMLGIPRDPDGKGWEKDRPYGKEYTKSFGRAATHADGEAPIQPKGDVVKQWGSETNPEALTPFETKSGTYQIAAGQGDWSVNGPTKHGEIYATQTTDGLKGRAGINVDAVKAEGAYSTPGGFATASASASAGYKAEAEGVITDHGMYGGVEVFNGAKTEAYTTLDWGPVKWTVSGAGEVGVGAGTHGVAGIQDGVIEFGGDASLAWGLGGKLGSHLEVDTRAILGGLKNAADWLQDLVQEAGQ